MLVLFDNGTPRTLARYLIDRHAVTEARARGWDRLENGELLNAAEAAGFDVIVTTDRNIRHQQNLSNRKIAIVALSRGRWTLIKHHVANVVEAVDAAAPGSYFEVEIPERTPKG
jgi:hypothetical protein